MPYFKNKLTYIITSKTTLARYCLFVFFSLLLSSCADNTWRQETNLMNICDVLSNNPQWHDDLMATKHKWNVSPGFLFATIYQESRFDDQAQSPSSSAFGLAQAQKGTWNDFLKETHFSLNDRSNFYAAINFIAWYTKKSIQELHLKPNDYQALYLAYHEGRKGYVNKTFLKSEKSWLLQVSGQMQMLAHRYDQDLQECVIF